MSRRKSIIKNPTPIVRWPFILYDNEEDGMFLWPFNNKGCLALLHTAVFRVFFMALGVILLLAFFGLLDLFGIIRIV